MKRLINEERCSVTIMVFVVMLFLSLYGAIILGNSSRKFQNQTNSIKTIQSAYNTDMSDDDLARLYDRIGAVRVSLVD